MDNITTTINWTELHEYSFQDLSIHIYSVNLSDVISQIETVENIDILQLLFESLVCLFSLFANILTTLVLWKVSFSHPAQTLRVAMAVMDLVHGITGGAMTLWNHSYYLRCASNTEKCNYLVDVMHWEDKHGKTGLRILQSNLNYIASLIHWTSWISNNSILTIMAIDRYFAICHPFKYNSIMSMKRTRAAIIITWITHFLYYFVWTLLREEGLLWKSAYDPLTKISFCISIKETLVVTGRAVFFISGASIVVCMFSLTVLLLYELRRMSNKSKDMRETTDESNEAIESTKTLVISMVLEALAVFGLPLSQFFRFHTSINRSFGESSAYIIYWFMMSSTFFNFIIFNLRIPSFRRKSYMIVKSVIKPFINILHHDKSSSNYELNLT